MTESPDARDASWPSPEDPPPGVEPPPAAARQIGPATPQQRRLGNRVALGIMFAGLLLIFLLDHYGILH
ncbi:MAG: hypothetical protein WB439_09040 [Acidobacteriaceae bacterium]